MGRIAHQRSKYQIPTKHDGAECVHLDPLCQTNRMKDLLPLMPASAQALLSIQAGRVVEIGPL